MEFWRVRVYYTNHTMSLSHQKSPMAVSLSQKEIEKQKRRPNPTPPAVLYSKKKSRKKPNPASVPLLLIPPFIPIFPFESKARTPPHSSNEPRQLCVEECLLRGWQPLDGLRAVGGGDGGGGW